MALVAFLRGVNVGGHKTFRPSVLAHALSDFEVINVGAAGTFVVRKPGSPPKFRARLLRELPFETEVAICDGRELLRLEKDHLFGSRPPPPGVVRFVSVLTAATRLRTSLPIVLPPEGKWLMRLIAVRGPFVFGEYRRHMKTIGYLGQIDRLIGARATTRNWNTIMAIVKILKQA